VGKQVANDLEGHTNDITCLKVNAGGDKTYAVSG